MLWDETIAQRGSNEIGSMLYRYLHEYVPPTVKHVVITSDSTVAQNRNKFVTAMLLFSAQILPNIETIEQKFLEPGHTEMEVDSMHSAVDAARKNVKIMVPSDWEIVLQMARRKNPYRVLEIKNTEIFDLHVLAEDIGANDVTKDTNGATVNWMKIKAIRVRKGLTDVIEVKEDYGEQYREIMLKQRKGKNTRQRRLETPSFVVSSLKQAYTGPLPVTVAKKKDLLKLCSSGAIPSRYKEFYEKLPTSNTAGPDRLPEPDVSELFIETL